MYPPLCEGKSGKFLYSLEAPRPQIDMTIFTVAGNLIARQGKSI